MHCNGSNWAVYSPGSWDGIRNDLWAWWAGVIMRLEHHLVGGYVRYISPYIIIIRALLSQYMYQLTAQHQFNSCCFCLAHWQAKWHTWSTSGLVLWQENSRVDSYGLHVTLTYSHDSVTALGALVLCSYQCGWRVHLENVAPLWLNLGLIYVAICCNLEIWLSVSPLIVL